MESQLVYAGSDPAVLHVKVLELMSERAKRVFTGIVDKHVDQVVLGLAALGPDDELALFVALGSHPHGVELAEWLSAACKCIVDTF